MFKQYHILLVFLFAFTCVPAAANAFSIVETGAVRLNDQTAVYSITYAINIHDHEGYAPVNTVEGPAGATTSLKYEVLGDNSELTVTAANITSDAEIKNGLHYMPASETREFTFYALVEAKPAATIRNVRVAITEIPVLVVDAEGALGLLRFDNNLTEAVTDKAVLIYP